MLCRNFPWSTCRSVSFVHFTDTFQCQSVILMCILRCQNRVQQGFNLSLFAISSIKSLVFLFFFKVVMKFSSSDTLCFKICCLSINNPACPSSEVLKFQWLQRWSQEPCFVYSLLFSALSPQLSIIFFYYLWFEESEFDHDSASEPCPPPLPPVTNSKFSNIPTPPLYLYLFPRKL